MTDLEVLSALEFCLFFPVDSFSIIHKASDRYKLLMNINEI